MALEIILLIVGLIVGFFIAKLILSQQKWGDKEEAINERWKRQIAEIEKEYAIKLEKTNTTIEEIKKEWQVKYVTDLEELKRLFKESEKVIRLKSVSSSRRSLVGKFIERFVPFLNKMPYEPSDMHFIGSPIDYIVFEGLHEDNVQKITFVEVKTGESKLTKREKSLKDAVERKRVSWKEINIDTKSDGLPDKDMGNNETIINELYENIDKKIEKTGPLEKIVPENKNESLSYFHKSKVTNPNSYEPWTEAEEKKLVVLYKEGKSIKSISEILKRMPGGIESRLKKLGLVK